MNGYKFIADSYRHFLKENPSHDEAHEINKQIALLDKLSTFEKDDKYRAFDSGMFNDIFKGYVVLLTEDLDEEIKNKLRIQSRIVLDEYNSKEAENKYLGK